MTETDADIMLHVDKLTFLILASKRYRNHLYLIWQDSLQVLSLCFSNITPAQRLFSASSGTITPHPLKRTHHLMVSSSVRM